MWVYIQTRFGNQKEKTNDVFDVGHYDPRGKWKQESTHRFKEDAARRVHYLNGGSLVECKLEPKDF